MEVQLLVSWLIVTCSSCSFVLCNCRFSGY